LETRQACSGQPSNRSSITERCYKGGAIQMSAANSCAHATARQLLVDSRTRNTSVLRRDQLATPYFDPVGVEWARLRLKRSLNPGIVSRIRERNKCRAHDP
jgi:hypothetical protein